MAAIFHTTTNLDRENANGQMPALMHRLWQHWLNGQRTGIVSGCAVTTPGGLTLSIADGWGVALGGIFSVTAENITAVASASGTVNGRLKLRLDTATSTAELVTEAAATLPELTQEDINAAGTVYEIALATYRVSETSITNLQQVFTTVDALYSLITALQSTTAALNSNKQNNITGGASTIASNNLTANRALVSDGNGKVAASGATATELGYMSGATSSVQTQLNGKVPTSRTVNGHALTGNVSVTKSDVGLGNVSNAAQMPLAGGTFTGIAYAQSVNGNQTRLRNIVVQNSSGTAQSTNYIIMRRK